MPVLENLSQTLCGSSCSHKAEPHVFRGALLAALDKYSVWGESQFMPVQVQPMI